MTRKKGIRVLSLSFDIFVVILIFDIISTMLDRIMGLIITDINSRVQNISISPYISLTANIINVMFATLMISMMIGVVLVIFPQKLHKPSEINISPTITIIPDEDSIEIDDDDSIRCYNCEAPLDMNENHERTIYNKCPYCGTYNEV